MDHLPLKLVEYNRVATVLYRSNRRPGDLLQAGSLSELAKNARVSLDRIQWLLERRINLGFSLEEWQRKGIWVMARSDPDYPVAIRKNMRNAAPPLLFGAGNQDLLNSGGLAVMGPDFIPEGRLKKACDLTGKHEAIVIVAGHLRVSKKIVQAVEERQGYILWVLHDGVLKQRLKKSHRRTIHNNRMVMITTQSPCSFDQSDKQAVVGELAVAFADEVLYVDGSNFRESSKRKDRFGTKSAALKRSEICQLLHGRKISPEGQELRQRGVQSRVDK